MTLRVLSVIFALSFLGGCATQLGHVPSVNGGVASTRIDSLKGIITNTLTNDQQTTQNYDVENYLDVNWKTGLVQSTPRFFEWEPIGGADYTVTQGFSWFAGTRFFSVGNLGLHWGVDGNCIVPLGLDYRKAGFIFGPQIGIPYKSIVAGLNPPIYPGFVLTLPF